jgi:hypothetical protein
MKPSDKKLDFENILLIASKSPSGDNLQPWKFLVDEAEKKLSIFYDSKLAKHSFNPEDITSCINFGMMLYLIEQESLRQGFSFNYTINEKGLEDINHSLIECSFVGNENTIAPVYSTNTILKRRVGRGLYLKKDLPLETLQELVTNINQNNELVDFKISNVISKNSISCMKKMECAFWNKVEYLQDIFKWVHLTKSSYIKVKRGFHWKELGINPQELSFIYLIKKMPKIAIAIFNLFAHHLVLNKFSKSLKNSGFALLSLKRRPTVSECFDVGRDVMKVWLKIAELEMVTQPLSIQSFFISFSNWGIYEKEWPKELTQPLESQFKLDFKVSDDYSPFWLFRFGYAAKSDNTRSLRLPVKELMIDQ